MKKHHLLQLGVFLLAVGFMFAANGLAQSEKWEEAFNSALAKAKEEAADSDARKQLLDEAIRNALNQGAPGCQLLKMAVKSEFDPYAALLSIYSSGMVGLDEICMCATEQGINKAVIAQAASNATASGGGSVYTRDEITQSQCLQAILPYTPADEAGPPPPPPPPPIPPASASTP